VRRLSTSPAIIIAAALGLLLVAYVLMDGTRERTDRKPHCATQEALNQVKAELFRRAAAVRGASGAGLIAVSGQAVVRAPSRMVRQHHRGSDRVTCRGSIVLDLPPGIAVPGGRRSLSSNVLYDLKPGSSRTAQLLMLSKAEAIVVRLAAVFQVGSRYAGPTTNVLPRAEQSRPINQPPAESPQPNAGTRPAPTSTLVVVRAGGRDAESVSTRPNRPGVRDAARPTAPASPTAAPAKPTPPRRVAVPIATVTARPSFNCRYARTRSEVAICSNPRLASLDSQMAGQFFRALATARPGQRAILQRSRNRFLRYRESCASEACIAQAYRGRIQEISDIMAAGW